MLISRRMLLQGMALTGAAATLAWPIRAQSPRKELRIGLSDYPVTLRPGAIASGYALTTCWALMHAQLLRYTTQGELVGDLAESWEVGEDGVWTIRLREARFSNGDPVTAEDAKWSIERMKLDEIGFADRAAIRAIVDIEIVDDRTIRLHTDAPNATIPHWLAHRSIYVLQKDSDAQLEQGIGAGPYVLDSFEQGVYLEYLPNPHYFREGRPKMEKVRVTSYLDENLRVSALLTGDVDLIDYVPWHAMDQLENSPGMELDVDAEGGFMYLYFNGSGVFQDARLRKAIAYAIRREELDQSVFYGRGAPMYGLPRPQVSPFYNPDQASYWRYDPDLARQLMQEAGVPDGFEFTMLSTSQYGFHRDTAVIVQSHLAELGIKANLELPDWATRNARSVSGEVDMIVNGSGVYHMDPSALTFINPELPTAPNRSHNFSVPGLATLIAQGAAEFDLERRKEIYKQVDQLVLDHTVLVGLNYRAAGFARVENLAGFQLLPSMLVQMSSGYAEDWEFV